MSFKTPYICDRRVYDKKAYWKNPNQDETTTLFFFVQQAPTLVPSYNNGLEELKEQVSIVVFGEHQFCVNDNITCLGKTYLIKEITPNYIEHNILVNDLLKERIGSIQLLLE